MLREAYSEDGDSTTEQHYYNRNSMTWFIIQVIITRDPTPVGGLYGVLTGVEVEPSLQQGS